MASQHLERSRDSLADLRRRSRSLRVVGLLALLAIALAARSPCEAESAETVARARAAVERALPLLQSSARTWTDQIACFSCHHQGLGSLAVALASETGFAVDAPAARDELDAIHAYSRKRFEPLLICTGVGVFGRSTTLIALGAGDAPRDDVTDAVAHFLASRQAVNGAWYSNEHRPPIEDSAISATALTVRALKLYGPEGRADEIGARIERARAWLEASAPENNEERAMRLLGLAWCGVDGEPLAAAARDLLATQREDGGWSQTATMASDAYATGQALAVLHQAAGLGARDRRWLRGARFLIDAQRDDGSWHVPTRRRIPGLPQVESGFPYGADQFVSYAASTWATIALALCVADPPRTRAFFATPSTRREVDAGARDDGWSPWLRAAAFGSLDELRCLWSDGVHVDARGPMGLTALTLAVHDPRKVEWLLERGADPDPSCEIGVTPLVLAAQTSGAADSVRHLLARGANVDRAATNGAEPWFGAASIGELDVLGALLETGARPSQASLDLALVYAASCGDVATGRVLLDLGADLRTRAFQGYDALTMASISGYLDFVELALAAGAELEARDADGMTALAWAAKVEPGHSRIVARLLRAGADPTSRAKDGLTPLERASALGNAGHAALLRDALARAD